MNTESRTLICQLSEPELLERGDELAKTYMKVAALDMEKKRITARIKPLDERIELLVTIIDTKQEEREVDCRWDYDFSANVKRLHRLDTYEVIDTKEIKDWERQQQLALGTTTSSTLVDLSDVCPKCEGDGQYIEDGIEDGGGEVFCDCPAGIAARAEHEENSIVSQCATCLGLCGDFTPGTAVSECPGFSAEPSPEMIDHRDTVCIDEWRECDHANACFGPANEEGPCDCIKNVLAKAVVTAAATALKEAREKRAEKLKPKLTKSGKGAKK